MKNFLCGKCAMQLLTYQERRRMYLLLREGSNKCSHCGFDVVKKGSHVYGSRTLNPRVL